MMLDANGNFHQQRLGDSIRIGDQTYVQWQQYQE
jgi:hypothetical protein